MLFIRAYREHFFAMQALDRNRLLEQLQQARFYGIVDAGYVEEPEMVQAAHELCEGGAKILQLRAKGWTAEQVEDMARSLVKVCREHSVVFVVNDFPAVALSVGADAVHVGQDDGTLAAARSIAGADMIVGRSTHSLEQAEAAELEGFDYIGYGPLFPTPTKAGRPGIGVEQIVEVHDSLDIPVFCIGGIRRDNLEEVILKGAKRVVVVSDVLTADCRRLAAAEVVSKLDKISL